MYKFIPKLPLLLLASALLASCTNMQFPGVYKVTVEQGNVITQAMIDQLEPGMSKDQVNYIMGSALLKDSFNANRWDYVYSIKKGDDPRRQSRLSIFFENDKLKTFSGDFVPSPKTPAPEPTDPTETATAPNT